jgi:hypothetical protein
MIYQHKIMSESKYRHPNQSLTRQPTFEQSNQKTPEFDAVMILSTNYDKEMEKGIEAAINSVSGDSVEAYHVLMPIYHDAKNLGKGMLSSWLLLTRKLVDNIFESSWQLVGKSSILDIPLLGPLVVKLHGSPMYTLPPTEYILGNTLDVRICHRIIISERSFLDDVIMEIPTGDSSAEEKERKAFSSVLSQLFRGPGRVFCFMGHSVSDWNIRLRLRRHVHDCESSAKRYAINRTLSTYQKTALETMNVKPVKCDLSHFVTKLSDRLKTIPYRSKMGAR